MKKDLDWKIKQSKKVIKRALDKWHPNIGVAFTGNKDSLVMMHIVKSVTKDTITAMFIDHGLHFDETYELLEKLTKLWKLDVRKESDEDLYKKVHNEKDRNKKGLLSRQLKIKTIDNTVKKYKWQALLAAIRWDEHPARANEKYFSKRKVHFRVHPILHFDEQDIWDYINRFKLPYNPLYDKGYRSLGEKDFTKPTGKKGKERGGREQDKEEIMNRLRKLGYF